MRTGVRLGPVVGFLVALDVLVLPGKSGSGWPATRDSYLGEKYSHGTWMRRAVEEDFADFGPSIDVGLRDQLKGPEQWTHLRDKLGLDARRHLAEQRP
jgi:hypothetical protein